MVDEFNRGKYVITGGPGFGKTSIISELKRRSYPIGEEIAREVVEEELKKRSRNLPWIDREGFERTLLQRKIEDYLKLQKYKTCFFDRGLPDAIGFFNFSGLAVPEDFQASCRNYRYDQHVFIVPPWKEIFQRDGTRNFSYEEAIRQHQCITEAYLSYGYVLVDIPQLPIKERADCIEDHVRKLQGD